MRVPRALLVAAPIAILAAIIVACGPGNNGPVAGIVTPGQTVQSVATLAPFTASGSTAIASALGVPIALPTGGSVSGSLTIPGGSTVPAGTVLSGSVQSTLPSGAPSLSSLLRQPASLGRTTQGETSQVVGILFGSLSLSNPITVNGAFGVTFIFPAGYVANIPSSLSVYMAMYDPTRPTLGWLDRVLTCTTNATASSITCTFSGTANIPANVTYFYSLYVVATSSTAPTPAPSVSIVPPTANPNEVSALVGTSGTSVSLPSEGGISGTMQIPATSSGSAVITGYGGASGAAAFLPTVGGSDVNTVLYVGSLTSNAAVSFTGSQTVTFNVPAATLTANGNALYYLATYDSSQASSGWFTKVVGPGVVSPSAGTITFTNTNSQTLKANNTYGFALYLSNSQPLLSIVTSTSGQTPSWPANSAGVTGAISVQPATAGVGNTLNLTMGVTVANPIPTLAPSQGTVTGVIGYGVIANTGSTNVTETTTSFGFNLPSSAPATSSYYLAFYDTSISPATGWFLGALGPVTPSSGFVLFATNTPATFQPSTKATYGIALYYK